MRPNVTFVLAALLLATPVAAWGQERQEEPPVDRLVAHLLEEEEPPQDVLEELVSRGRAARDALREARSRVPEGRRPLVARLLRIIDVNERASRSWLPLARGFSWTYGTPGSDARSRWTVGSQDRFKPFAFEADGKDEMLPGHELRGLDLGEVRLACRDNLAGLWVRRKVGYAGRPAWIPDLRLPLDGPEAFIFETSQGGCVFWKVRGRRAGPEVVQVPAGRFKALRFRLEGQGVTMVWLARGVGIVKVSGWPASSYGDRVLELRQHVTRLKP